MKRLFILALTSLFACLSITAQTVIIKQGTPVPVKLTKTVSTETLSEGERVSFATTENIMVDGHVAIPIGSKVVGIAKEVQKSRIVGLPGHINISLDHILLADGTKVFLTDGRVFKKGKSRMTGVIVGACFVWPLIFITGPKTVMEEGFEARAEIQANTTITR